MKRTISVSKTYKHRGSFRHKPSTKKHWFHYFYIIEDGVWKLHCESINWLQALFYKSRKWHRMKFVCLECSRIFLALVKSKKTKQVDCPYCET